MYVLSGGNLGENSRYAGELTFLRWFGNNLGSALEGLGEVIGGIWASLLRLLLLLQKMHGCIDRWMEKIYK